jgi:magnesium and cobalt transporter
VPVHDLPDQINLFEDEDDTATVGGVVTKELGRIPETQEILELAGLQIKILEADDTRVLSLEIQWLDKETPISEETE